MEDRKDVEDRLLRETSTMPVFVDQELADLHYNGFSNRCVQCMGWGFSSTE